jgi:hypothetical protein
MRNRHDFGDLLDELTTVCARATYTNQGLLEARVEILERIVRRMLLALLEEEQ